MPEEFSPRDKGSQKLIQKESRKYKIKQHSAYRRKKKKGKNEERDGKIPSHLELWMFCLFLPDK